MATSFNHRHIFFNNLSNVMKLVSYLVISFFMAPFYVRTLGMTLYGIWTMVLAIVGYMYLMDLGMQSAVMKYVAEFQGREDKEALDQVIASALVFYCLVAFAGGTILVSVVFGALNLAKINPEHLGTVRLLLLILGVDVLLVFPGTVFQGVLTGLQRFYVTNSINIAFIFVKTGTIYWMLSRGHGLVTMAVIGLIGNFIEYIIFFILVRWRYRVFSLRKKHFDISRLRHMLSFGCKSFLIMISGRINLSSDSLIVGYFMSAAWVPFYSIPASLINYCRTLLWSLTQSFLPLFSNLEAKRDFQAMQSIFLRYTRYTCLLISPVLVLLIVYGEPFLRIWMGPQFADKGGAIVVLLTLALSISALQPLSGRLLTGTARQGLLVWTGFCSAGIFVFLSVLLIQAYGLSGLATAFLISTLVPAFFELKYSLSVIQLSLINYFKKALASPILVAALAAPLVWSMKRFHYPREYVDLVLQSATGLLLFGTLVYLIALSREERAFINNFITTLRRTVLRTYWGS